MKLGIDPKVDYAFKKLFGSVGNEPLLLDLVQAVLGDTLDEPIVDLELQNPFNPREMDDDKLSILDIKARDRLGRLVLIEMQMRVGEDFRQRTQYYLARTYVGQLRVGEDYGTLRPTIAINFLDGVLNKGTAKYHSRYTFREDSDPAQEFSRDWAIHIVELPKFRVAADRLSGRVEQWCYFLRHGDDLEPAALPAALRVEPIERAVEVLRVMSQTSIEQERYEARLKDWRDRYSMESTARNEGERCSLIQTLELGLKLKFGSADPALLDAIRAIDDLGRLRTLRDAMLTVASADEFRAKLG